MSGNIIIDEHHADLLEAMHRLFEDRLGFTVYIPDGLDWWNEGYWRFGEVFGDDRLARQFLLGPETDTFHPQRPHRRISLEDARKLEWSAVVATVQENQSGFHRFAQEHGAQFIVQVGNTGQRIDWSLDPLALNSSEMPMLGRHVNIHQEFDKDGAFAFTPYDGDRRSAASFVNLFPHLDCYPLFDAAKRYLPSWRFDVYGHGNEFIKPTAAIAPRMAQYAFAWHDKITGDGFGHVLHQWAAIGRPLIGHASHYRGKLGEHFWEDGVTCIDLDRHSISETVDLMTSIDADQHAAMCREIRRRLDASIDYTAEAAAVASALGLEVPA